MCRKQWEELSARRHSFLVGSQVGELQTVALRRAYALHDSLIGKVNPILLQASSVIVLCIIVACGVFITGSQDSEA